MKWSALTASGLLNVVDIDLGGEEMIFSLSYFFLWEVVTGWPVHPNAKVVLRPDSLFVLKKA